MQLSHTNLSSISISFPSSNSTAHEIDSSQGSEGDHTPAVSPPNPNDDPNLVSRDSEELLDDSTTATFRRRRLRAAKLSRFFGVTYNDLLVKTTPGRQADGEAVPSSEVGVKIQERGWFWNRADNGQRDDAQEADMHHVIALLRQMPRA